MVISFAILQKWACSRASKIIYSMSRADEYFRQKLNISQEKLFYVGQPIDCQRYDKNADNYETLPEEIKEFIDESLLCVFSGY